MEKRKRLKIVWNLCKEDDRLEHDTFTWSLKIKNNRLNSMWMMQPVLRIICNLSWNEIWHQVWMICRVFFECIRWLEAVSWMKISLLCMRSSLVLMEYIALCGWYFAFSLRCIALCGWDVCNRLVWMILCQSATVLSSIPAFSDTGEDDRWNSVIKKMQIFGPKKQYGYKWKKKLIKSSMFITEKNKWGKNLPASSPTRAWSPSGI